MGGPRAIVNGPLQNGPFGGFALPALRFYGRRNTFARGGGFGRNYSVFAARFWPLCPGPKLKSGRVAEWFKAPVLKTGKAREGLREFESHPFRHSPRPFAVILIIAIDE